MNKSNLSELLSVPVPVKTRTYTPISNQEIHNTILFEAQENGFEVGEVDVNLSSSKLLTITHYTLKDLRQENPSTEMNIRVGFKNSYDRSCSFGFAIGSVVIICTNGMVKGEYTIKKQHRVANVAEYVKDLIHHYFTEIRAEHRSNVEFSKKLREHLLNENQALSIIGSLFKSGKIMTQSQLKVMCKEMYESTCFNTLSSNPTITAWDLYNHGTEALKSSVPSSYFARYGSYDEFFRQRFK